MFLFLKETVLTGGTEKNFNRETAFRSWNFYRIETGCKAEMASRCSNAGPVSSAL